MIDRGKGHPKVEFLHYSEKRSRCGTCGEWYLPVDFEQHEHQTARDTARDTAKGAGIHHEGADIVGFRLP